MAVDQRRKDGCQQAIDLPCLFHNHIEFRGGPAECQDMLARDNRIAKSVLQAEFDQGRGQRIPFCQAKRGQTDLAATLRTTTSPE